MAAGPIVYVSDAETYGGAERQMALLAAHAGERGAVEAWLGPAAPGRTREELALAGARVRVMRGLRRRPVPAVAGLAAAFGRGGARLVHVNATDQGDAAPAILAARRAAAPVVVTVHVFAHRSARRDRISARVLGLADRVVAVSDGVAARLGHLRVDATVIENGLDPPAPRADARASLGVADDELLIGGVGRLTRQKGWDVFCLAAAELRSRLPGARLIVIGAGPEREALEPTARANGVELVGERADAASLLHAFDLVVAPSRDEGFPLVPIEAMQSGVAVAGSDIPGMREVIADERMLFRPDDPDALTATVLGAVGEGDELRASGAAARARAIGEFSAARMLDRTFGLYAELGA